MGEWNAIDGFDVQPILPPHPVETSILNFRVLGADGYKTYSHLADIAAFDVLDTMVTRNDDEPGISAARCAVVKAHYTAPADVKKVDVGGGLIHGNSADFKDDESGKLILAHTSRPLTMEEMRYGAGADVGTEDILIKNLGVDYHYQMAAEYLAAHFSGMNPADLQILLNNEIRTFNPQEILMSEGQSCEHVIQVVSGNVERFKQGDLSMATMTAGSILGKLWAITDISAYVTYRAGSYVRSLMMPVAQYHAFVDKFGLREHIEQLAMKRRWLRRTQIFGDGIAYERLNLIAEEMIPVEIENGRAEHYGADTDHLYLVEEGILKRMVGENVLETLRPGDIYNEGCSIFGWQSKSSVISVGPSKVWRIPVRTFENVPNIIWMLFEDFRRRIRMIPEERMAPE